jgi:hypothetical protein
MRVLERFTGAAILLSLVFGVGTTSSASAAVLFFEDFESSLDPRGSIIGLSPPPYFGLVTGSLLDPSGNAGNTGVGHSQTYSGSSDVLPQRLYDLYQLRLDLRGYKDIKLSFNYGIDIPFFFDVFGVLAYLDVGGEPLGALVEPTPVSGFPANTVFAFTPTNVQAINGERITAAKAVFEFAPGIDDQQAFIQIGLAQSSATTGGNGFFIDNVEVEGTRIPTPAPVPATLYLLGFGVVGVLGFGRYCRRLQA